jgi:tagatose-6-phosphate ketose/aldose isomerase
MSPSKALGVVPGAGATPGATVGVEVAGGANEVASSLRALAAVSADAQDRLGYRDTLREICQQPATWGVTARDMTRLGPRLRAFLAEAGFGAGRGGALVLTGSGSSLYVAATVAPALQAALGVSVHAVGAGDLLTNPASALPPARPCAVMSFARSGNSPESAGLIDVLLAREPGCRHVVLTCCATGQLATRYSGDDRVLTLVLDERTCDRSLVMTCSFTSMAVAAHALRFGADHDAYLAWARRMSEAATHILAAHPDTLADVARSGFRSAVFLGSGCRYGGAREAGLKLTEMSDGRVWSFAETYLGVRHGPMTAIRDQTLVVCFLSSDPRLRAYEVDLITELTRKGLGGAKLIIGEGVPPELATPRDRVLECPGLAALGDDSAPMLDLVTGQLLAFFHCLHLGLRPDAPSVEGVINRVVAPFPIYGDD